MSGEPNHRPAGEDRADDRSRAPSPVESDDMETGNPFEGPEADPAEGKR